MHSTCTCFDRWCLVSQSLSRLVPCRCYSPCLLRLLCECPVLLFMQTRADFIACIGENVSKKHGLTNRDVCVACCDMCVASGLASLADSALVASDSNASVCADWLAKKLLLVTGQALCSRRVPQLLWTVLLHMFLLCSAWLFPSENRWRGTSPPVEKLWACSAVCRSLLWLAGQYRCHTARKVGQLMEPRFRWVLWRQCRPREWPHVLTNFSFCSCKRFARKLTLLTCMVVAAKTLLSCMRGRLVVLTMSALLRCKERQKRPPQAQPVAGLNTCVT